MHKLGYKSYSENCGQIHGNHIKSTLDDYLIKYLLPNSSICEDEASCLFNSV